MWTPCLTQSLSQSAAHSSPPPPPRLLQSDLLTPTCGFICCGAEHSTAAPTGHKQDALCSALIYGVRNSARDTEAASAVGGMCRQKQGPPLKSTGLGQRRNQAFSIGHFQGSFYHVNKCTYYSLNYFKICECRILKVKQKQSPSALVTSVLCHQTLRYLDFYRK